MARFNKDTFRGLLIPDERVNETNIDDGSSTFTQADPQPGIPVPQGPTDLNLEASGTQSASKQLRVATQRGGHPGGGKASFRWKQEADSATSWRGAWPFSAMSGDEVVRAINPVATSSIREAIDPHAVLMDDNKVGVVYDRLYFGFSANYQVAFFTVSEDGTVSGDTILYGRTSSTQRLHPCIVKLPDGRLNVYHYLEDEVNDLVQVQLITSDDNGATWTTSSTNVLDEPINVASGSTGYDLNNKPSAKMRVAYSGGQMLMIICARSNDTSTSNFEDGFFQYASSDNGQTFEKVEEWDRTINGTQAEIVPSVNGFEVFFCQYTTSGSTTQFVRRRSLASAFMPLSTATDLDGPEALQLGNFDPCLGSGRSFQQAELAACVADDGQLYIIARGRLTAGSFASSNLGDLRIAVDPSGGSSRGQTYDLLGQGTSGDEAGNVGDRGGTIYFAEGTTDHPRYFGMVAAHGRIYLFHNARAGTSTRDNTLWMMTLGGYQTATLGTTDEYGSPKYQVCWDRTYLPIELPDNFSGWTAQVSGTNSSDVNNGYLNLSTGAGKIHYFKAPTGTIAEGIIAHFACQVVSYSGIGDDFIFARFKLGDGSDLHTLDVFIRNGSVQVEDNNGGGTLGNLSINTTTNGVEVLVFFRSGKATVYARPRSMAADNTWSAVCSNANVTDSGTGSMEVRFGHTAGSTAASRWYFLNYVSNDWAGGVPSSTGFTNPDDLTGKMLGSAVSTYITDGTKIRGIDGPTIPGDSWNIDTRYGFGIENALVPSEPSPQKGWRSTNESAQEIVWSFTGPNSYSTLGIYLDGCNWRTGTLHGWNPSGGGSWVSLASIDMAAGQTSLAFQRLGDAATVNTSASTTAGRYYELDELVGGTVDLGSSKYRTITANSPGIWTNAAGHVLPALRLSGVDNSEPSSGTLNIWSPRILLVIHDVDLVFTKFKLTVAAQQTATDDLRIGQVVIGGVQLFSQDYSHGRVLSSAANTDLTTYRDGSRSSIKRGPNRRSVSFGWGEGVDVTPLQGSSGLAPDYVLGSDTSGAPVVGYRGDIPSITTRLLDVTGGSNLPVVYIPTVDKGSAGNDQKTIQGLGPIYGRIVSSSSQDALIGDEGSATSGEVMRISTIEIEEEL